MNMYTNFTSITKELNAIKTHLADTRKLIEALIDNPHQHRKGKKLEKYLLVHEVAERLGLHINTIYRFMREEGLPFIKIGRLRYIREDDVVALLERQNC